MKFNQITHIAIEYPSGRRLVATIKKGIITVNSDAFNENFNTKNK